MPPLATLPAPRVSRAGRVWMMVLRGYLIVASLMVVVRVVQLALAGG